MKSKNETKKNEKNMKKETKKMKSKNETKKNEKKWKFLLAQKLQFSSSFFHFFFVFFRFWLLCGGN